MFWPSPFRDLVAACWLGGLWLAGASAAEPPAVAQLVERENIVEARRQPAPWKAAAAGHSFVAREQVQTGEFSRATIRFGDLTILRMDELNLLEIIPPASPGSAPVLDQQRGRSYFWSREKDQQWQIHTPAANGALRGTEFALSVDAKGRTTLTMFDGAVEFYNQQGRILLHSGEQGVAEIGKAPRKTAVIDAVNIIQWCLYYPGVLDPAAIGFTPAEEKSLGNSLQAYRAGDLLGALQRFPHDRSDGSPRARLYRAAVLLAVGQVEKARRALATLGRDDPGRVALEHMIAAVTLQPRRNGWTPHASSEWLAESYYRQSRGDLAGALAAARQALERSPDFGFAWTRVAELEFSFGRIPPARQALERALKLVPSDAQAHALEGFLLSAQNRIAPAARVVRHRHRARWRARQCLARPRADVDSRRAGGSGAARSPGGRRAGAHPLAPAQLPREGAQPGESAGQGEPRVRARETTGPARCDAVALLGFGAAAGVSIQ